MHIFSIEKSFFIAVFVINNKICAVSWLNFCSIAIFWYKGIHTILFWILSFITNGAFIGRRYVVKIGTRKKNKNILEVSNTFCNLLTHDTLKTYILIFNNTSKHASTQRQIYHSLPHYASHI